MSLLLSALTHQIDFCNNRSIVLDYYEYVVVLSLRERGILIFGCGELAPVVRRLLTNMRNW